MVNLEKVNKGDYSNKTLMTSFTHFPEVPVIDFLKHAGNILKNPLPFHQKNFEALGDTFRLNLGLGNSVVFSRDPEFAIYALRDNQKNFKKTDIQTKDLAKYVGHGLLTSEGENWKTQRKLIQPAFHKKNLYSLLEVMVEAIDKELERIEVDTPIDIFPIFNDLAFKVVVKSLFSDAINAEEISRLQHITEETQKMLVKELRQPYKKWWFVLSGELKRNLNLSQEARDLLIGIIKRRQNSDSESKDLLDMLMALTYEDGSKMDQEQLIDEILILFIAGHETTSNALSFTIQLIGQEEHVQEKLVSEIDQLVDHSFFDILKESKYTDNVIQESMRLFPPVYFIDRQNIERDSFKGFEIPPGTTLLFSVHQIHRNASNWENPTQFKPERFQASRSVSNFYFPFGAGPRKCIGNNFAMYEIMLTIHRLLKTYKIEQVNKEIEIQPLISLKPKNAIVKFSKR
ncbi:cytochrome P450 monooxygenase, CypX superfamily protein [Psychroflexus gondwanensis ACAM 44]|uniref:Cytochrome P450 monooxygenase, CypX superfamily protein n=2 Tax=Psychroflexus gondwanensis TaxID=251 RepID=N1WVL9_9FLAO|nr:cytochrome P450 monooxygenase, CypX superfamily protein [Psychroflexus gondwanensis ACAM 44]